MPFPSRPDDSAQAGEQAATAALQDARQELAQTQRRGATLALRLGDSRAQLKRLQAAQLAASWSALESSAAAIRDPDEVMSNAEEQCTAANVPEEEHVVRELESQLEDVQAALSAQAEAVEVEQARCTAMEEQCASAQAVARRLQQELQEMQTTLQETEAAVAKSSQEAAELRDALAAAQDGEAAAQASADKATELSEALSHRSSEAQADMSRAQALTRKALAECAAAKAMHADELTALRQQCAGLEATAASLEEQLHREMRRAEAAAGPAAAAAGRETPSDNAGCSELHSGNYEMAQLHSLETMCRWGCWPRILVMIVLVTETP